MSNNVINIFNAEGFNGQEKKSFEEHNPWTEIYAAIQNNLVLQEVVMAIEDHEIEGENTACMVLLLGGTVKGLIPAKESGFDDVENEKTIRTKMRKQLGQMVAYKVRGIDKENNLCILSRAEATKHLQSIFWKEVKEGETKVAVVREVFPYGAIVNIGGIEVELPSKEMSHGWVKDARELLSIGDVIDVKVILADKANKKVKISLKPLLTNYWEYVPMKYKVDGEYLGTITGIEEYGVFITLDPGVYALIPLPHSERIRKEMKVGQKAVFSIKNIDVAAKQIQGRFIKVIM